MITAHLMDSLGWAVAHSLWQGALAAIAVYIFRSATRDSQASLRCGFELIALLLCCATFAATFSIKFFAQVTTASVLPGFPEIIISPFETEAPSAINTETMPLSGSSMTRYTPFLGIFWCFGFLLLAIKYSVGFAMTRRLRTRGLSIAPAQWQNRFETLVLNAGIFRQVALHISNRVTGPVTLGFFKPVVLVPASFFSGLPAAQIEAILLHEIAHIRRHDYLINLVQTAIKTILFYHPAVHYICRSIDEDREQACDDFAVQYTKDPASLAKGLATLRLNLPPARFAMAASRTRKPLLRRLTRLTAPEESRRRPGQIVTSMAALAVAAGIYLGTNVEFANAHPDHEIGLNMEDSLHVSADKKNYRFKTVPHGERNVTVKIAETGTRWVSIGETWYDIDKTPDILGQVPVIALPPFMPRPKNFKSHEKFEKAANQYRVNLDYYIASLENTGNPDTTRSKLHWARKQRDRVSAPTGNFDKDLLRPVAPPEPIVEPQPISRKTSGPETVLAGPPVITAPPAVPAPVQIVRPQPAPRPAPHSQMHKPSHIHKTAELAGDAETSIYANGNIYSYHASDDAIDDIVDRLEDRFDQHIDFIEDDFEHALDKFENAAEVFAENPQTRRDYFKNAQRDFSKAIINANKDRAALTARFEKEVEQAVRKHVSASHKLAMKEAEKARITGMREAEKARQQALKEARRDREYAMKEARRAAEEARREAANSRHHFHGGNEPRYENYGKAMLFQMSNDGLISAHANSANVEYRQGDMYVNGSRVNKGQAKNYCGINSAFHIQKTDNMQINISPQNLTIIDNSK